ncbi:MAG: esterase-like activity of phytase family protein [Acetobacterales bacterium]
MRILPLLLILFLSVPAAAEPVALKAEPVPLDAENPMRTRVDGLRFLAGFSLSSPDRRFGGLSALRFGEDRGQLIAVTDDGHWVVLSARHDLAGVLVAVDGGEIGPLLGLNGAPMPREAEWRDSESLARRPKGGWYVGFERRHRIRGYGGAGFALPGRPHDVPVPRALYHAPFNEGLETLVTLADGRLLAVSERLIRPDGLTAGWLFDGRAWAEIGFVVDGPYRPTDATLLPGGDLLFVERRYNPITGLGALIRRVPREQLVPGGTMRPQTVARLEAPVLVDNYEGIAARPAPGGGALVYIVSDDNFRHQQRTLLLQFLMDGR